MFYLCFLDRKIKKLLQQVPGVGFALYAQDFKQEGNLALQMGVGGVQRNESPVPMFYVRVR